MQNPNSVIVT